MTSTIVTRQHDEDAHDFCAQHSLPGAVADALARVFAAREQVTSQALADQTSKLVEQISALKRAIVDGTATLDKVTVERDEAAASLAFERVTVAELRLAFATAQREHSELTRSTEVARAAIARALGLTEWCALADLAAEVTRHAEKARLVLTDENNEWLRQRAELVAERDAARAEVAQLTAERDEYRAHFGSVAHGRAAFDEQRIALAAARTEVARLTAEAKKPHLGQIRYTAESDMAKCRAALAASRAEVEALRAVLREGEFLVGFAEHLAKSLDPNLFAVGRLSAYATAHRNALSSTPAPASAELAWTSKQVIAAAEATFAEYKQNAFQSPHPAVGAEEAFALDVEGRLLRASAKSAVPTTQPPENCPACGGGVSISGDIVACTTGDSRFREGGGCGWFGAATPTPKGGAE